jgi:hypothetical protein
MACSLSLTLTLHPACQVRLPLEGSRLIVASDGVWDAFEKTSKVPAMSRGWSVSVRGRHQGLDPRPLSTQAASCRSLPCCKGSRLTSQAV